MLTIEDLEHRVTRLESLFEEVVKERLSYLAQRLDQLYEKTERDKTEILTKTDRDKRELICWMGGMLLGFATLLITAMWALLSFAVKP